ncbi:succinylglutamate desuccinylase/aspartoacylase family protein [Aquimarina sp. MMG016]|uniref:succinylglutamate desuccinylase/aspartoacylase family protein n=1 Tax=Aquimarina sp. MMG016 TaxID=2822690 RepID=UPI001B3A70A9|nr:succinylglutamate desuccinylase/aspartoacylase family protein [Aquimarina sp. MMG016]MBQ4821037.1 succinylglutamate desuccinylase/aspartoacylase family protein [Aquimarina sp. MMG016]
MVKVYSKALKESIKIDRIIGSFKGSIQGPTLIFIGGIHGNEPAGVFALDQVLKELEKQELSCIGNIYAISGNLQALESGKRYYKEDLNRVWTSDRMNGLCSGTIQAINEDVYEQIGIYKTIIKILETEKGPFYFFDLHTTSSKTTPFLTVNDSLLNRKFTMQYPVPMILGIEEYLNGPLLSYINELGYISFGFEGGQHNDPLSIKNHVAFIYLSMIFTGCIDKSQINYHYYYKQLANSCENPNQIFEIFYRHNVQSEENFSMEPGFINFQKVNKNQKLATHNAQTIFAPKSGRVFMPLYQNQGDDGFFVIKEVLPLFLHLSSLLRKIRFDHILPIFPGIRWISNKKDALRVNLKVARFFTKQFFHLIGYRSKQIDKTHLIVKNRETASRKKEYKNAVWNVK